uniref:G_PROTEIN_RECEP_F1_2 domain-containing protein n=1 Tax=Panagrellus redivivus TaxID=6233 RepID=A0A7E4V9K7_PANRE
MTIMSRKKPPPGISIWLIQLTIILITLISIFITPADALTSQPAKIAFEKSCRGLVKGCGCIYRIRETRCCCFGDLDDSVSNMTTALHLFNSSLKNIQKSTLRNFTRLQELVIDTAYDLAFIDARTFDYMPKLRKISIENAPNLETVNGTLIYSNHKLQTLSITHTGLTRIPDLKMSSNHALTMEIIDFSHNRITFVDTRRFDTIFARTLRLSGNEISYVDDKAFANSKFINLHLNDNHELTQLSKLAFADISEVHKLDLSGTSIRELPVVDLKDVEHLVLKNVPYLKKLPPVLAFNNLNKAEFTYPYHCCFFKYATKEYTRGAGAQYSSHYREIQQRSCAKATRRKRSAVSRELRRSSGSESLKMDTSVVDPLEAFFKLIEFSAGNLQKNDTDYVNDAEGEYEFDDDDFFDGIHAFSQSEVGESKILVSRDDCEATAVELFYLNISCAPLPDALNPCEDIVGYRWLRYTIWIIAIIAVAGNVLVWVVIATSRTKHSRIHYFFMLNLSIADFLTGLYLMILAIQDYRTADAYYNYAVEWQTGWICSFAGFLSVFASELSISSMLMIAFEIYYNAKFAIYGKRITPRAAAWLMGIGYSYAIIMAVLPWFGVSSYQRSSICLPLSVTNEVDKIYLLFGLSVSALCFFGMVANYILINRMVRYSSEDKDVPPRPEDKQIFRRSLVLIGTNMICWVPVLFFGITATLGLPLITLTNAKICLILFYPINSCANPCLYVFLTRVGREAKNRAILNLKRQSGDKSFKSISRFYYSQAPHERSSLRGAEDNQNASFLQVTQTTSLSSTPRSSSASDGVHRGSTESDNSGKSPNSIDTPLLHGANGCKRKSLTGVLSGTQRPRVSAAPEMSVISEHSSNSADHESSTATNATANSQSLTRTLFGQLKAVFTGSHKSLNDPEAILKRAATQPNIEESPTPTPTERRKSPPPSLRIREERNSDTSLGVDSGIWVGTPAPSLEGSNSQPRFSIHSTVLQPGGGHRSIFRRGSELPSTPTLVLSEYVEENENNNL